MWISEGGDEQQGVTDDGSVVHDSDMFAIMPVERQEDMIYGRDTQSKQTSRHPSHTPALLSISISSSCSRLDETASLCLCSVVSLLGHCAIFFLLCIVKSEFRCKPL